MPPRDPLIGALRRVAWRVRAQRALGHGATFASAGLGVATLGVGVLKLGDAPARGWQLVACGAALPWVGAALGLLRPVAPLLTASLLDAAYGLRGLCASAWAFRAVAPDARSRFMRACVERAERAAQSTRAALALPLRAPRGWPMQLALALGLLAVGAWDVPRTEAIAPAPPPAKPRVANDDDLAALREEVEPLSHDAELDPDLARLARDLNDVLERLAERRLDRIEALREIAALDAKLDPETDAEDETLREALRSLGRTLGKEPLAAPLREALAQPDARRAAEELRRLTRAAAGQKGDRAAAARATEQLARAAKQAGSERDSARKRQLDRLEREAERAAAQSARDGQNAQDAQNGQQARAGAQQSAEEQERLLQRKQKLDELRKQIEQEREARRQMEQLGRDLDAAAGALGDGKNDDGTQALERAAQQFARMGAAQRSAGERARLQARLEQLRAMLRRGQNDAQASQGGRDGQPGGHRLSLGEFAARARGDANNAGAGERGTLPGEGGEADANLAMPGENGAQGTPGAPMPGASPSSSGQAGDATSQAPGAQGGREAGSGGRPMSADTATSTDASHVDSRVTGERRAGPTRSEVIVDGARRGFASSEYRAVHQDYREYAERVLEHDRIPGGYRFYVRRYFELIRPREHAP